jgi:hypothetical protein
MNDQELKALKGKVIIARVRLDTLAGAIQHRKWDRVEFEWDRVNRALQKVEDSIRLTEDSI